MSKILKYDMYYSMNTKAFWDRIKTLIKKKGVTQAEAAKSCGINFYTFRNWMSVNMIPPVDDSYTLSRYLGVSIEYLIKGKETDRISKANADVLALLKRAEEKLSKI